MYTKDIVNCDPVKHFIPEFQPCDGCSRSKKISDDFKSKVDSIKDALLFLSKRDNGFTRPGKITNAQHKEADKLLLFLTELVPVTNDVFTPKTFMELSKRKRKNYANLYTSIDSQKINNDGALTDKDWSQGRVVKPAMKEEELDYPYDANDAPADYYNYYLDNVSF